MYQCNKQVWTPHDPDHPVIVWSHSKLDGSAEITNNICTLHLVWSATRPDAVGSSSNSVYGTWRGTRYDKDSTAAAADREKKRRKLTSSSSN